MDPNATIVESMDILQKIALILIQEVNNAIVAIKKDTWLNNVLKETVKTIWSAIDVTKLDISQENAKVNLKNKLRLSI